MESKINWLHLPDIIWELILSNLKGKDLLRASETCKKFNNLLSMSERLMTKLRLKIRNPYRSYYIRNETDRKELYIKSICELNFTKQCLQKSERKYESMRIFELGFNHLPKHTEKRKEKKKNEKYITNVIFDIFKQFAGSVKQITFYDISLQDNDFYKLIQVLKNLKVLKFEGYGCDREPNVVTEIFVDQILFHQ